MSVAQLFLIQDNTSDANFRAWGSAVSAQLDTAGWTKTSDTGQVNWTTVTVPAAGSFVFEIRIPASDPLQTGATQYFLKVEYGTKATTFPQVRVTLGTGTNGSGTLTGMVGSTMNVIDAGTATVVPNVLFECDFSWDASRLNVLFWRTSTAGGGNVAMFGIERIKTLAGADSSDGVTLVVASSSSTSTRQQSLIFGVGFTNLFTSWASLRPTLSTGTSDVFGGGIPISPLFPSYGKFGNPHTMVATANTGDVSEGALVSSVIYGTSHVYMCSKIITPVLVMRFE